MPAPSAPSFDSSADFAIDFDKSGGLVPVIAQDAVARDVLMVAYMNAAAIERTLASGYVTFYSRSRAALWVKGATSGNRLRLVRLSADCDGDALLAEVEIEGDRLACHRGRRSCFLPWSANRQVAP